MSEIRCVPRWREELEAIGHGRKLIFELIREIDRFHLNFPAESRWGKVAPAWAARTLGGISRRLHGMVRG